MTFGSCANPTKHPTIFATYAALSVGESFVLVNNHDPKHLHDEFEAAYAGSYGWEVLGDDAGRERPEVGAPPAAGGEGASRAIQRTSRRALRSGGSESPN